MRQILPVLLVVMLSACVSGPHFDDQVLQFYQTGKSREEIQKHIGFPPIASVDKPTDGWHPQQGVNHDADSFALNFEKEKKVEVQRVEVYWIGRGTSIPLVAGGVWWDYLFYDRAGNLLGYRRRFLD